ncbi:protein kinase [Corynebacterium sp. Q4381]|uniref:serine/threonine-protein kinase n=1 Tax=Corynebacterium sp. Marseille-Q4381 TaxID=3121597 RepID=UPI002FE68406
MNTENRDDLQQLIGPDYQLQWVIGHGGMSTVWLADDAVNEREVALKILRPEYSGNEEFLARFRNEALAAEGINSPNVVATYDYREVQTPAGFTMCFIAMEYIRGESLADMIAREGQLEEDLALDVLEQAAHGLAVIHRMGLVHRDIKPGNLMLTQNGQIKITDFGIAKAAAAVPLTRTGMVVGTAQYVSPEQAQGLSVTTASDVYSLSVVGYEMLSGNRPFTGDSSVSVALAHVNNEPPPLPISVSAPARELIEIGLRKNPDQRFRDGNEIQLAIRQVRDGVRPTQPGGRTQVIATEPSPSASTQLLADVADNRTTRPAGQYPPSATRAVQASRQQQAPARPRPAQPAPAPMPARAASPRPAQPKPAAETKGSVAGPIIATLLLLALIGGGLAWAWTSGAFDGVRTPAPTTPPTTVTETETVEEEPAPPPETTVVETVRETPTQEAPGTITFEPEPETQAPAPEPETTVPEPSTPATQTRATPQDAPVTAQDNGGINSPSTTAVTGGDS